MSTCKQCGGAVKWVREEGRAHCLNPDGTSHWDTCSKRRWDQVKATGERFERKDESGYANSVHGTKRDRISAKPQRGANYTPSCGQCAVPPWERCDCSFPAARAAA